MEKPVKSKLMQFSLLVQTNVNLLVLINGHGKFIYSLKVYFQSKEFELKSTQELSILSLKVFCKPKIISTKSVKMK